MRSRLSWLIIFVSIAGLLLPACTPAGSGNAQTTYQISPLFRELYEKLGGEDVLGPAISKSFKLDSFECQYTTTVMICVNPQLTNDDRLFFYPLADGMNIQEDPGQSPAQTGSMVIDGYTVYDEFIALYNQLGGQLVGRPLTQAHINYSQQRIEQYFENVGFYRKFSDPVGSAHLLAYGAYSCIDECSYTPLVEASILNASRAGQDQPLLAGLSEMGDTSILGNPLTQPYIASDGMEEQVYENVVLYAPLNNPSAAKLRPLSSLLNIPRTEPGTRQYSSSDGMVFYATDGSKGYHVPLVFDQFIAEHGGKDFSGNPIGEVFQYLDSIYRQCFENYCLDYDASAPTDENVRMAALGAQYMLQISGSEVAPTQPVERSSSNIVLTISEQSSVLSGENQQKIDILVTQKNDLQPVTNVEASLVLNLPDGSQMTAGFPATGLDGRSSVVIPKLENVTNGTILEYQVCLIGIVGDAICGTDSYVIWSN
jgi:hypothetical protein